MTDTDMMYMAAQEKRIEELEEEMKKVKELLRETQPVLRRAFFANYKDTDKSNELYDRIVKIVGKE